MDERTSMLKRYSEIANMRLRGTDREIGHLVDLLLDGDTWNARYLVIAVRRTIPQRRVLISPAAVERLDFGSRHILTNLGSDQLLESPLYDWSRPVSSAYERSLVEHFGWPIYWLGRTYVRRPIVDHADLPSTSGSEESLVDLHSVNELCGFEIEYEDGHAGYMKDVVVNIDTWRVDFAVADPNSWIPDASPIIATAWTRQVDWSDGKIQVDLQRTPVQDINRRNAENGDKEKRGNPVTRPDSNPDRPGTGNTQLSLKAFDVHAAN